MKKLTFEEFYQLQRDARAECKKYPYLGFGQCCYNLLFDRNKELALHVMGTEADPFYARADDREKFQLFERAVTYPL